MDNGGQGEHGKRCRMGEGCKNGSMGCATCISATTRFEKRSVSAEKYVPL